jgi:hypothetical protein
MYELNELFEESGLGLSGGNLKGPPYELRINVTAQGSIVRFGNWRCEASRSRAGTSIATTKAAQPNVTLVQEYRTASGRRTAVRPTQEGTPDGNSG